jgi:hypothetical protein
MSGGGAPPTEPPGRAPHGCQPSDRWPESANLQRCAGEFVHRPSMAACPLPKRNAPATAGAANSPEQGCTHDGDCAAQPNGYCTKWFVPTLTRQCVYACETDAECGPGKVCGCQGGFFHSASSAEIVLGQCIPAGCSSDAECGAGLLCISPLVAGVCAEPVPSGFRCQTPEDRCSGHEDCGSGYFRCEHQGERFACIEQSGAGGSCGRPFLVRGVARAAELTRASRWTDVALYSDLPALPPAVRARIAAYYGRAAAMEHASIAAFARFSLQLLALGAPASLVEASAQALVDETRHARLCFGLAARYADGDMAPGQLDVNGALDPVDLLDIVRLVIDEGCAGESIAALEACAAADLATDRSVKPLLAEIAADETRHAELAFRFVAWAAERDARVAGVVRLQIAKLLAEDGSALDSACDGGTLGETEVLLAHGVLDAANRRLVRSTALRDVVVPALRALAVSGRAGARASLRLS